MQVGTLLHNPGMYSNDGSVPNKRGAAFVHAGSLS